MFVPAIVTSVILEWLIYLVPGLWRIRRVAVFVPLALTLYALLAAAFSGGSSWMALLVVVTVFRVINHVRIIKGRMHERYLYRTTRRSGYMLGVLQLAIGGLELYADLGWGDALAWLVTGQVAVALTIFLLALRNIYKTRHRPVLASYSDKELPTVTVAIPARNETADLEDCLRSILANNYPKFEVLVLDDCSHDRTPEVIKSFAHKGVRFIKGREPDGRWLAKNLAYDKLADEATGEVMLFCGVDVRFGPETIRALVTTLLARDKDMLSVLPRRLNNDVLAAFIQPMRYWWELVPPRRLFNRPPVLSTCWMIRRQKLRELGGFDAVQNNILPEGYFAREAVRTDGYSFVRADDILDVQTRKSLPAQRQTAIRMRYPQLRRRLEWAALLTIGELLFLLGPFVIMVSGLWVGFGALQLTALAAGALLILTHVLIVQASNPTNVLVAIFNLPIVVLVELYLSLLSLYRYEFSTVTWKDRDICLPVMHAIPSLPKLD